jgi:hypothetical protein
MVTSVRAAALPSLLLCAALAAQHGSPAFEPRRDWLVRVTADDVPSLITALTQSRLGKLLAEPECADMLAAVAGAFGKRYAALAEAAEAAAGLGIAGIEQLMLDAVAGLAPADFRCVDLAVFAPPEGGISTPACCVLGSVPAAEGRWTRCLEALETSLPKGTGLLPAGDKVLGFPGRLFAARPDSDAAPDSLRAVRQAETRYWLLHLPEQFTFGVGAPELTGTIRTAAAPRPAGIGIEIGLDSWLARMRSVSAGFGPSMEALGIDDAARVAWRAWFEDALVQQEVRLELGSAPHGLIGALVTGDAALPAQPLPAGAMLQLRLAVDVPGLLAALKTLAHTDGLPTDLEDELAAAIGKACTGGLALGVGAPAPGGVLPRVWLSLGVRDARALDALLAMFRPQPPLCQSKTVQLEGIDCTALTVKGLPPALTPTFCFVDSMLTIAESPASLRALLQSRKAGAPPALDVGKAPLPKGEGEPLATFDLRSDEVEAYRALRDAWLPLFELMGMNPEMKPLLRRGDMPPVDVVAKHLGASRGTLRRQGNTLVYRSCGTAGGPLLHAALAAWAPIMSGVWPVPLLSAADRIARDVARERLLRLGKVQERWRNEKQPAPATLAELYAQGNLADDALHVPGDDAAEVVAFTGADGAAHRARCSFRYAPAGVDVDLGNRTARIVLIERAPRPFGRLMLGANGETIPTYGAVSSRPIDYMLPAKKK